MKIKRSLYEFVVKMANNRAANTGGKTNNWDNLAAMLWEDDYWEEPKPKSWKPKSNCKPWPDASEN